MSRRHTPALIPTHQTPSAPQALMGSGKLWLEWCVVLLSGILIGARYFHPTENSDQGETLWLTVGWFFTGGLFAFSRINLNSAQASNAATSSESKPSLMSLWRAHFDLWDLGVMLLAGGHILSGLVVLMTHGNKYLAINLMWEWCGLLVTWFVLRNLLVDRVCRKYLIVGLIGIFASLAGLGVEQYTIFYPDIRASLRQQFDLYDRLSQKAALSETEQQQLQLLQADFHSQNIPLEKKDRASFEQRVFYSQEIFGFFALANTFAGILLIGVIWMGILIWHHFWPRTINPDPNAPPQVGNDHHHLWRFRVVGLVTFGLLLCTLILTKSRTAFVALAVSGLIFLGIELLGNAQRKLWQSMNPKMLSLVAGIALVLIVLTIAVSLTTLDQQVITEAPKSLRYRLEYWYSSAQVVKEHTLWGTGLGQFRHAYLKHKLLGASEEIKDPHNLILDVWANGGIIALTGLGLLALLVTQQFLLGFPIVAKDIHPQHDQHPKLWVIGLGLSFPVAYFYNLAIDSDLSLFVVPMGLIWAFVVWGISSQLQFSRTLWQCGIIGMLALGIHLLGAGGIGMPAIVQTILICLILSNVISSPASSSFNFPRQNLWYQPAFAGAIICSICLGMCMYCSWIPKLQADSWKLRLPFARSAQESRAILEYIVLTNPLDPDPRIQLATLKMNQVLTREINWEQGLSSFQTAFEYDPQNPQLYRMLAQYGLQVYEKVDHLTEILILVREMLTKAISIYPTDLKSIPTYAYVLKMLGEDESAKHNAARALKIDQTNRDMGHVDKLLDESDRIKLRALVPETESPILEVSPKQTP
jgi:O-antigen ligase